MWECSQDKRAPSLELMKPQLQEQMAVEIIYTQGFVNQQSTSSLLSQSSLRKLRRRLGQNKSVSIPLLALSSASDRTSILVVLQFSVVPSISPISFFNHFLNAVSVSNTF